MDEIKTSIDDLADSIREVIGPLSYSSIEKNKRLIFLTDLIISSPQKPIVSIKNFNKSLNRFPLKVKEDNSRIIMLIASKNNPLIQRITNSSSLFKREIKTPLISRYAEKNSENQLIEENRINKLNFISNSAFNSKTQNKLILKASQNLRY